MRPQFYVILTHEGIDRTENGIPLHLNAQTGESEPCKGGFACEKLTIGKKHYIIRAVAERIAERQNDLPGNNNYSFVVGTDRSRFMKKSQ